MDICNVCGIELGDTNWYPSSKKRNKYICISCVKNQVKEWRVNNRQQYNDNQKKNRQNKYPNYPKEYYNKNKEIVKVKNNAIARKLRFDVLSFYSEGKPKCACCNEDTLEFLCLYHINGGGNKHRKSIDNYSIIYRWIKKNNFPIGFRVLCHNCNSALGFYGHCPHDINREKR